MSELHLTLMALVYICLAAWRNSVPAVLFGLLVFSHAIFLGKLVETDTLIYMVTGGIFSTLAMAGCYGFRASVNDVIAFRMAAVAAACLLTNIMCIIVWSFWGPTEGFNYVFAAILLASIVVILKGDKDELGKIGRDTLGSHARPAADKVFSNVAGMESGSRTE